ncbi:MAG: hypothetical protein WC071_07950, partial [Victivallaceae bacterium]
QTGLRLISGFTIYGSENGEYGIADDEYLFSEPLHLPRTTEEIRDNAEMQELFSHLADNDILTEKHPSFKSDIDKILDELMAV